LFRKKLATPFTRGENMEKLKGLALSFTLMSVLAVAAFAGETPMPPCAPGETEGPPCSSAPVTNNGSTEPGQTSSPPASDTIDVIAIAEAAFWALTIY
jgi:hypothetical protein